MPKANIDQIVILRRYLRHTIDPEHLRSLAESIEKEGLLQPIVLRPLDNGMLELIAGRRRLEAAKLLAWQEIEYSPYTKNRRAELPAFAENLKRDQMTPLEEAELVAILHTDENMSIAAIAEETGHGTSWVQDRLAVGNLPAELKEALHAGYFRISAALILSRITDQPYRQYLTHIAKVSGCTANQAEAWWLDWTARQKLTHQDDYDGVIPQPLPHLAPPPMHCFLCSEQKPRDVAVVVTICSDCCTIVKEARTAANSELVCPAPVLGSEDKTAL